MSYTVVKGDTLSELAVKFNTTVSKLVELNNIKDPDYIVIGQVLRTSDSDTKTTSGSSQSKAIIDVFGVQSNTEKTLYVTWNWDRDNTQNYECQWEYATGDGIWFIGSESTTTHKQSIYTPPDNATKVRFKVKPNSETYTSNNKQTVYWTAQWSTYKEHTMATILDVPGVPDVKIENYKLTATLDNLDVNGTLIEFEICKNNKSVYKTAKVRISTNHASYTCNVISGAKYKVRCRTVKGDLYSEWSQYSNNMETAPEAPDEIKVIKALSATEVQLDWTNVDDATTYEIEYTTEKRYFNSSDQTTTKTVDATVAGHAEITGLETGQTYFFRVRACNDSGKSGWTEIKSITIGKKPTAPTTWSSATTIVVGDIAKLYWVHNTEDGSSQTYAQLELTINGVTSVTEIKNTTDEDEKDKASVYSIDTSYYTEGTIIKWRVKTKGVLDEYSEWSTQRTIDVYAPPELDLEVNDVNGTAIYSLTNFPFYVEAIAGPNTQEPIGYHVSVIANDSYETVDQIGNSKTINAGDAVYSKYFNTNEDLVIELSAGNIDLENNISYTVQCIASMNSGLTAEAYYDFNVAWSSSEDIYEPNATISYDPETFTMNIKPYCDNKYGVLIKNLLLSVYRINYDGSFTEIATGIENTDKTYVTDPHPSLNYARYRIVAESKQTGKVGYFDMSGYYIGEKAIIIQWSEDWKDFVLTEDDPLVERAWTGSLLRLPYNIDISESNQPDVAFVEYIGRENPVSYYGTQKGNTSTWNTEIDREDVETLYALRRLAEWMGDVYVREPSGLGYWANIQVSFSQKHKEVTIPVTLNITKVEGGM